MLYQLKVSKGRIYDSFYHVHLFIHQNAAEDEDEPKRKCNTRNVLGLLT